MSALVPVAPLPGLANLALADPQPSALVAPLGGPGWALLGEATRFAEGTVDLSENPISDQPGIQEYDQDPDVGIAYYQPTVSFTSSLTIRYQGLQYGGGGDPSDALRGGDGILVGLVPDGEDPQAGLSHGNGELGRYGHQVAGAWNAWGGMCRDEPRYDENGEPRPGEHVQVREWPVDEVTNCSLRGLDHLYRVRLAYTGEITFQRLGRTVQVTVSQDGEVIAKTAVRSPLEGPQHLVLSAGTGDLNDFHRVAGLEVYVDDHRITGPPRGSVTGEGPGSKGTCSCADPVNTATGEYFEHLTDIGLPGRGPALSWNRSYSTDNIARPGDGFGPGWSTGFGWSITEDEAGAATVTYPGGATLMFTPKPDRSFMAPGFLPDTLVNTSTGAWTYFQKSTRHTFTFDAAGRLGSVSNRNGETLTIGRDATGRVASVTDGAGQALTVSWTGPRITSVADSAGRSVSYAYNAAGLLASATDMRGEVQTYTYDSAGRILTKSGPGTLRVTNTYDSSGRVTSQDEAGRGVTLFGYTGDTFSDDGGVTTVTDPEGRVTRYAYQVGLLIERSVGPASAALTTQFGYDPVTLDPDVTIAPDGRRTAWSFDAHANLVGIIEPDGGLTQIRYDAQDQPVEITGPQGEKQAIAYDSSGNVVYTTDPDGVTVRFLHDNPAHPGDVTVSTDDTGGRVEYGYDSRGLLTSTKTFTDDTAALTIAYGYNTAGQRTTVTDAVNKTTTTTFDSAGLPLTITRPGGGVETLTRDAIGNVTLDVDPRGTKTVTTYDAAGRAVSTTQRTSTSALLRSTSRTLDSADRVLTVTDANGQTTRNVYDPYGRLSTVTVGITTALPAGAGTTTYNYDAASRVTKTTDAAGRIVVVAYDLRDRPHLINGSGPVGTATTSELIDYDDSAHLVEIHTTLPGGASLFEALTYTPAGRLRSVDGAGYTDSRDRTVYGYDVAGRLATLDYPDTTSAGGVPARVTYTRDRAGRVTSLTSPLKASATTERVYTFTYDPRGPIKTITRPNGTLTTNTFNNDGAVSAISTAGKNALGQPATLASWTYGRDLTSLLTSDTGTTYTNDPLRRLTQTSSGGIGGVGQTTSAFAYDPGDRLTSLGTNPYTYGPADRLTQIGTGPSPARRAFTYNSAGDRLTDTSPSGRTVTSTYDALGQTISTTTSTGTGTLTATYQYSHGLRATKKSTSGSSTTTTAYAWDRQPGVPRLLAANNTWFLYAPDGTPLEQINASAKTSVQLHTDQLGSVRLTSNNTGTTASTATYTPYGTASTSTGTQPLLGWAGQPVDAETGLVYLQHRYYDPSSGTFTQRDPAYSLTGSAYGYVAGSPLNTVDPLGLYGFPNPITNAFNYIGDKTGAAASAAYNGLADAGDEVIAVATYAYHNPDVAAEGIAAGTLASIATAGALFYTVPAAGAAGVLALGEGAATVGFAAGTAASLAQCVQEPRSAGCAVGLASTAVGGIGGLAVGELFGREAGLFGGALIDSITSLLPLVCDMKALEQQVTTPLPTIGARS